jgi:chorismate lyase/3-hydroxybenzoate synthase
MIGTLCGEIANVSGRLTIAEASCPDLIAAPPSWVSELMGDAVLEAGSGSLTVRRRGNWALVRIVVPQAISMARPSLERATYDAYREIAAATATLGQAPVRFWNFVPELNASIDAETDRYMAFNVGRYDACVEWWGAEGSFGRRLATASAVGVRTADLEVYCLTTGYPLQPVENPRQVSAYHYSVRYGRRPPCFARATRVQASPTPLLLIGGTASIVGEESQHPGDLIAQTHETLDNIAALVANAAPDVGQPLGRLRQLRIYLRNPGFVRDIGNIVSRRCEGVKNLEFVRAQVCRRELLVEIEGTAGLPL